MENKTKMSGKMLAATILMALCALSSFGAYYSEAMLSDLGFMFALILWSSQSGLAFIGALVLVYFDCNYRESSIRQKKFSPFLKWSLILIDYQYAVELLLAIILGYMSWALLWQWIGRFIVLAGVVNILVYLDNKDRLARSGFYHEYTLTILGVSDTPPADPKVVIYPYKEEKPIVNDTQVVDKVEKIEETPQSNTVEQTQQTVQKKENVASNEFNWLLLPIAIFVIILYIIIGTVLGNIL